MLDADQIKLGQLRRITQAEYWRLIEIGLFADRERVELIHGMLVQMSPIGNPHNHVVSLLTQFLVMALQGRGLLRVQSSLVAGTDSVPEPDFTIVPPGDYFRECPAKALLVIEVSDSSLAYDRRVKAPLYAAAGVPEYWIVNLVDNAVEVHREIKKGRYRRVTTHGRGEQLSPLSFPDIMLPVAAVLPPTS